MNSIKNNANVSLFVNVYICFYCYVCCGPVNLLMIEHHDVVVDVDQASHSKSPVTPGLRPGYDLPATEKRVNRRKNVRLVAEVVRLVAGVVGDRKWQISRNKVVVMFKTRSHRAYDQVTTYLRSKNVVMMGQS